MVNSERIISPATASKLASANPLDVSSTSAALKMINTQLLGYYRLVWPISVESWNNWKRSGYPVLTQ